MKRLSTFWLLGLLLISANQYQSPASAGSLSVTRISPRALDGRPSIVYAEWIGKNLVVSGEGFSEGATVLINGQAVTTKSGVAPTVVLIAKKARKRIPTEQEITVQVENPNGDRSDEISFYSGITISKSYSNETIRLRVGDIFLLYLTTGDPAAIKWSVGILGPNATIITQLSEPAPIPRSQGFFRVTGPGQFELQAIGSLQCPPLPAQACSTTGANDARFSVTIVVE